MHELRIVIRSSSRFGLAKLYIVIREAIQWFGLEDDITVTLDGNEG